MGENRKKRLKNTEDLINSVFNLTESEIQLVIEEVSFTCLPFPKTLFHGPEPVFEYFLQLFGYK